MKQLFTLFSALFLLGFVSQAQKIGKVSGFVTDGSQKIVESATISLLKAKDSSTVKFSVASKEGAYVFEGIGEGRYMVSVTAVGHQKAFSPEFEITPANSEVKLATIELVPLEKSMSGVTVVARRPFIEQKMDRMLVNVDASVTNSGSTALEVLEKSPGVTVDKDGNISLKGKSGVMVMIDGRPAYLSGTELSNYLKNLPANALEQIEIMTNPPAKYDAAGNAGIINIKTKKNKLKGFNGNVSLNYGQGFYWRANNSVNLNYRTEKLNLFANANQSQWNSFENLEIKRTFRDASSKEVTNIFEQVSRLRNQNGYYNLKLGADYYVSKNTTVGFVASGFLNPEKFSSRTVSQLMDPSRTLDSQVIANSVNNSKWKSGSVNLNFRHQFDTLGTELTADLDYLTYSATGDQDFLSTSYLPDMSKIRADLITSNLPIKIDIHSAKFDYSRPLAGGYKFEAGAKTSDVRTINSAFYYNVVGGVKKPDNEKTNQFLYRENISAAYVNLNKEFGKWGVQTGLRFENTSYTGKQFVDPAKIDSTVKKNYGSLFPTLYVSYKMSDKNQFGLSAGRRIQRPAYQDLNPFLFFIDRYTYESGNPFLRPQFTNNLELTHTFNGFLTTTLNYSYTKDFMMQTFSQEESTANEKGYATILRRGNIGKVNMAGISVNAQIPVTKWWNTNIYSNLNYNRFRGPVEGEEIDIAATNVLFNVNNQFKFAKTWGAELSGFYRTPGIEGQIQIQSLGQASAGINKQIMKGKGTVKFSVRDLFLTNKATGTISFSTTEAWFRNSRDSRVANFTFTYRFGKPLKSAQPKRKTGGADDEQSRVKAGGNN